MQADNQSWKDRFGKLAHDWAGLNDPKQRHAQLREAFACMAPSDIDAVAPVLASLCEALPDPHALAAASTFLDQIRRRKFVEGMSDALAEPWANLAVQVIRRANHTTPELLRSREETDPNHVALRVLGPNACDVTVAELARRSRSIARGLLVLLEEGTASASVEGDSEGRFVALLAENSLESALCDIACLTNGIVNIRLPANSTPDQVQYILQHSGARVLIASDDTQLSKVLPSLSEIPALRSIVLLDRAAADRHGLLSLEQLVAQAGDVDDDIRKRRAAAVRIDDLATIMYTSGTTGLPKGIMFSHLNVVSKRFCRAFALPQLGEGDVFLSFLPLFHTFGRWLELMGTLFWGATYVFARNPSQAALIEDFKAQEPTVFISVPKKWTELYEQAVREAGGEDSDRVPGILEAITGGRMRHGLSAAGYLDPVVFRAMNRAGVALCSGYGMTEATGGITMTPPGGYRDGSIGCALPGIDLRIAEDGELLIRGPYVMMGYFRPEDGNAGLDEEGWFATGDIVAKDDDGHYRLVDRKKEIYKNRKGQTIVPQRIENLYRDFDVVSQAFLVGDQLEYNTLLIWPNYEGHPELRDMPGRELRDLLGSLVVSANRFLAPYERVVAFDLLPRALSEEQGELTPKLTFKRQVVRDRYREIWEHMYSKRHVSFDLGTCEVRVPNWILRDMGMVKGNLSLRDGVLSAMDRMLTLRAEAPNVLRVGDLSYRMDESYLDLGALLSDPATWLGNDGLCRFLGDELFTTLMARRREPRQRVTLASTSGRLAEAERARALSAELANPDATPWSVHAAAVLLRSSGSQAADAVRHLERGLSQAHTDIPLFCRAILHRTVDAPDPEVTRLALRALVVGESEDALLPTLQRFFGLHGANLLRDEDLEVLADSGLPDTHVQRLVDSLSERARVGETNGATLDKPERELIVGVMRIVTVYAVTHPSWFARVRYPLARLTLHGDPSVSAHAGEQLDLLQLGFRVRIGTNVRRAVDPASGEEYGWGDAVVFDDVVPEAHRDLILRAITNTTMIRESVFLFGKGVLLNLGEIPRGSLWVSHLGTKHGKSVYRLSIQTRARGSFDVALNLAESLPVAEMREEIRWLMSAGDDPPLVELFGGYFPEYGIFTEEFIPGETVDRQVARLVRLGSIERLRTLWPFLVWSALGAHIDFWDRSGRTIALAAPSPSNLIIPSHDYHVGARLISISDRVSCTGVDDLLRRFERSFVEPVVESTPQVASLISPVILLSAFLETLGFERGTELLRTATEGAFGEQVQSFLQAIDARGYTPKRVYFASQRYARWIGVNPGATIEARGDMLRELWDTYHLDEDECRYPDTRIRFFRQTVFKGAREQIASELDRLMAHVRKQKLDSQAMSEQVAAIRGTASPTDEEDYFLARMAFRHLRPSDQASLISLPSGYTKVADVVVALHDSEGGRFRVRGPVSPRDVGRLLGLFHEANMVVAFAPEHEFLLAVDDDDHVVGGVFFRQTATDRVFLEKIVVSPRHRKRGISDGLMREFMKRMRSRGMQEVTTGYFRPEYLLRFGFRPEARFGGLVRDLRGEPIDRAPVDEEV
jgi:long-subunit acyl-CoA synthetase (AMP-forming)/GNAT superfamily N-acetyltransferase